MIEMWDGVFSSLNPRIRKALDAEDGSAAFEAMHEELDKVWAQCFRALKPGGFACINIGDATRTLGGVFRLWPNHARILTSMVRLGFCVLPDILWRKQTNTPNKFMGSGMLPPGAYVTYEHEYVLIFRKGANRAFKTPEEKKNRNRSAYFWEERNVWFSDVWTDLKGTVQELGEPDARARSGAYPFELAYRIVNMYSVASDTVLDPFLGTGTTAAAAVASGRSSLGVELDKGLAESIRDSVQGAVALGNARIDRRLSAHAAFVEERLASGRPLKHQNLNYGFPVVTSQERELLFPRPQACSAPPGPSGELCFEVDYSGHAEAVSSPPARAAENIHCSRIAPMVQLKQGELSF
jgi:DNA modification methylase